MTLDTGSVRIYGTASARHDAIIARAQNKFITWKEGGPGTACVCGSCVC